MARFHNVPSGGYLGLTNSKVSDGSGGISRRGCHHCWEPFLAWISSSWAGLLDALMTFDFGQLVIDDEIAKMIKRVRRGFEFLPETISFEEIKETGPAGMFAGNPETLERMTKVNLLPELADRKPREQWSEEGASTIRHRAMDKALDILSTPTVHAIDDEIDGRIHETFDDLVSGNSVLPEGWVRILPSPESSRGRRVNRRRAG